MATPLTPIPQATTALHNVGSGTGGARQSLRIMRAIIRKYKTSPIVIAAARQIVNQAGITTRDYPAQVYAIFNWIQQNISFVRDPTGVDLYMTPDVILHVKAGDCDDMAILFCSMMESIGHPCALMAIQQPGMDRLNHVIALTRMGAKWICADPTAENHGLGYCPPGTNYMVVYI